MSKGDRVLQQVLQGTADANIAFADLRNLLLRLGFEERIRGSHHSFRRSGVEEKLNLQKDGSKAKPYQVRQVRNVIVKYRLGETENAG
jgi:predicted RNA binding protein YcfA (HicA-like mRNA interferase family)